MSYYEREILPELVKGEVYTEKELVIFLVENKNSKIISMNSIEFNDRSTKKHKILDIFEGYVYENEKIGKYKMPNEKSRVYYTD